MYRTSDLSIAAFLKTRGLKLTSAYKESSGKFNFEFDDPQSMANSLVVEFANSELSLFDANLRALKKMLNSRNLYPSSR